VSVMTYPLFRPAYLWQMRPDSVLSLKGVEEILRARGKISSRAPSQLRNMLRIGQLL
jgi:hypothetical protein